MRSFALLVVFLAACDACGDNANRDRDAGDDTTPDAAVAVIGPETPVDDPVNGNAGQNAFTPYVAFNGTQYLAVWSDTRISRDNDIFAARIGTDGTIMDATGILVNSDPLRQTTPVVAWVSDRWLVVWNNNGDIDGATINSSGVVTQLSAISTNAAMESLPAIAASGATALVAWQSGSDIVAAQWSNNNFGTAFNVAVTGSAETDPAVAAASATTFLVAYTDACTRGYSRRNSVRCAWRSPSMHAAISSPSSAGSDRGTSFNGTSSRGCTQPERLQDSYGDLQADRNLKSWHHEDFATRDLVPLPLE